MISKIMNYPLGLVGLRLIRTRYYNNLTEFADRMSRAVVGDMDTVPDFARVSFPKIDIPDKRFSSKGVNTVLAEVLDKIIDIERFKGTTVLEVGPKFGFHSLWIDKTLHPRLLVMADLQMQLLEGNQDWLPKIKCRHSMYYGDVLKSLRMKAFCGSFDLVFLAGVLYHNVEQIRLLNLMWKLTKPKGTMLLQSTIYNKPESLIKLTWEPGRMQGYCYPSPKALLTMLVMTGWNDFRIYSDYRPKGSVILLTCDRQDSQPISGSGTSFGGSHA